MKKPHTSINNHIPTFALFSLGGRISGSHPTPKSRYEIMSDINQIDPFRIIVTPGNLYKILDKMIKSNLIYLNHVRVDQPAAPMLALSNVGQAQYSEAVSRWAQTETDPANIPALLSLLSAENRLKTIHELLKAIKINLISDQETVSNILTSANSRQGVRNKFWAPVIYRQKTVQSCLETVLEFERQFSVTKNHSSL